MFAEHTIRSVIALVCVDEGVTQRERDSLVAFLRGGGDSSHSLTLMKYPQVARATNLSMATVKRLAAKGVFERRFSPGIRSCLGVTAESVENFVRGRPRRT